MMPTIIPSRGKISEHKLSYSKMPRPGSKKLGTQMDVAEVMIYGTVTEFEAEATGAGLKAEVPNTWDSTTVQAASGSVEGKNAHMAIDVRVVDTASGRLVAARRIAGSAASGMATVGTNIEGTISSDSIKHKIQTPLSLGVYKNTPMELAIRDCIYRAVIYSCNAVPLKYFKH